MKVTLCSITIYYVCIYDSLKFNLIPFFLTHANSGEFHLGYTKEELNGSSWYQLIHWEYIKEAQMKHRLSMFTLLLLVSSGFGLCFVLGCSF